MKTIKREHIEIELRKMIESLVVTLAETQRIWKEKEEKMGLNEFERGRTQGIILFGRDMIDNLKSFGFRTGVFK